MVEKRGSTAASAESQGQRMLLENKLQGGGALLLRNYVVMAEGGVWGCEGWKSRPQLKQLEKNNSHMSSDILRRCCGDTFKLLPLCLQLEIKLQLCDSEK